ncbi:MAG: type I restriction enzyme HsdR N-terminal domain-containing protein [Bacteroidales bacterium]|nr:type I restriction enzyme HsdR N-terminal domain-containing protein [Bacteroidales bacterium]MDZ4204861.1 type I restriction enzyme HsdR N-terminal domain-containing protein [Bacteroidales bacterium]
MHKLNLPAYNFTIREREGKPEIFDMVRKQYVALTPEEWVRQHFIRFLIEERQIPIGLIGVEKTIKVSRLSKRCDIIVFDRQGKPQMVVECKQPAVKIDHAAFEQATRYNLALLIRYMVLTNGLQHFCLALDYQQQTAIPVNYIPCFEELGL